MHKLNSAHSGMKIIFISTEAECHLFLKELGRKPHLSSAFVWLKESWAEAVQSMQGHPSPPQPEDSSLELTSLCTYCPRDFTSYCGSSETFIFFLVQHWKNYNSNKVK